MNVDPNTPLQRVLAAFPASRDHLRRLGIDISSSDVLQEACQKAGLGLADVQAALSNIDWTPAEEDSGL